MLREGIVLPLENGIARLVVPYDFYRGRLQEHEKVVREVLTETSGLTIETVQFLADSDVLEKT